MPFSLMVMTGAVRCGEQRPQPVAVDLPALTVLLDVSPIFEHGGS